MRGLSLFYETKVFQCLGKKHDCNRRLLHFVMGPQCSGATFQLVTPHTQYTA